MLVVAVLFSFDTEELTAVEKAAMSDEAGGRLRFLPRRHIECYLLDPEAIAAMIVSKDPASAGVVTGEAVAAAIAEVAAEQAFQVQEWQGDIMSAEWLTRVDAAKLIGRVTGLLSEHRATFNKKKDSLVLLTHILDRSPDLLTPLYDYVRDLVETVMAD